LFPYTHKEFEPEDSPQDIDIFASLGKPFLPGLGKVWVKKAGVHFAEEQKAPNVVIMLDRSGSMKDCEPYAKAACIATANAYLANSAAVAVYVFNDGIDEEELAKGYQTDRDSVHAALAREARGDTKISDEGLKKLDEIVAKSCSPVDIVLVTDLEIDGRERLFSYLHGLSGRNRVTIVYTGRNGGIEELKKKYDGAGYAIFAISSPEQIPGIVIGEVAEGLK
jgi:hypothetical protein